MNEKLTTRELLESIAAALWSIHEQLQIGNGICPECDGVIEDEGGETGGEAN